MIHQIDIEALSKKMHAESDRTCVILGASAIHIALEDLLRSRLICNGDALLTGMGPLASFSAQIKIARALDLIHPGTESDLDQIRAIRNLCAHSIDTDLDFSTQSVKDRCNNLKTAAAFLEGLECTKTSLNNPLSPSAVDAIKAKFSGPRWRFQLTSDFLIQQLGELAGGATVKDELLPDVRALGAKMVPVVGPVHGTVSQQDGAVDAASRRH